MSSAFTEPAVAFCVGTGRCGTTFIAEVAGREPDVAASHERQRLAATFHMFCQWNRIPIDDEGFLVEREAAVRKDLAHHRVSFESSALLSHSMEALHTRFNAKFLHLVRHPAATVASFAVRGWFLKPIARRDPSLPPSYREGEEPRHFFGRNIPHGAEFERWERLTQIGKLAWFWAARNRAILEQRERLGPEHSQLARLEELDVDGYRSAARFLGWDPTIRDEAFQALADARLNAGPHAPRTPEQWTDQEFAEFEQEVGPVAQALGYALYN